MNFCDKLEAKYKNRMRQSARRERFQTWKSTLSCVVCGESETCVLDFHHVNPAEKEGSVAAMSVNCKWETVQKEITKCIVLCSNCHRKFHAGVLKVSIQPSKLTF